MKLRLAQMWDHNGTNMEALGFMYRDYKVLIALNDDNNVQGECLSSWQTFLGCEIEVTASVAYQSSTCRSCTNEEVTEKCHCLRAS